MAAPGTTTGEPEEKLSEEQTTAITDLFGLLFNVRFTLIERHEGQSLGLLGGSRIVIKREPGPLKPTDSYNKAFRVVKDIFRGSTKSFDPDTSTDPNTKKSRTTAIPTVKIAKDKFLQALNDPQILDKIEKIGSAPIPIDKVLDAVKLVKELFKSELANLQSLQQHVSSAGDAKDAQPAPGAARFDQTSPVLSPESRAAASPQPSAAPGVVPDERAPAAEHPSQSNKPGGKEPPKQTGP